jgi:hypothetical protein
MSNGYLTNDEIWLCVCALACFVFYLFGVWRGNKDAKRKDEELKRTRDSAERWESEAQKLKTSLVAKQASEFNESVFLRRERDALKEENGELKKMYADELQKRLELAELVKKHEQTQKDTEKIATEAIKNVNAGVGRGEVPTSD